MKNYFLLCSRIKRKIKEWRDNNYEGCTETSKALLNWWFNEDHLICNADGLTSSFKYYFAQREAVETVVWLYDVEKVKINMI